MEVGTTADVVKKFQALGCMTVARTTPVTPNQGTHERG